MKLYVLSDLHLEMQPFEPKPADADVVILAGDIHLGTRGVEWALQAFTDIPVLYVSGNHEFYGHDFPDLIEQLKALSAGSHVHVLEHDAVEIGGMRFLGCSLWTDFALYNDVELAQLTALPVLADYRAINMPAADRKMLPQDTVIRHQQSRKWLEKTLPLSTLPTVVITHHAPATPSVALKYKGNPLNPGFVSPLDRLVRDSGAKLWIHGHTHTRFDYTIGETRVVCNPRGYPREETDFNPIWLIDTEQEPVNPLLTTLIRFASKKGSW